MYHFQDNGENVPATADLNVGYCEANQQSRVWLVTTDDLDLMYKKFPSDGAITLWCDGVAGVKRNRESVVARHKESYTIPQYRLWARMYTFGIDDSLETPPNIPAFSSNPLNERNLLLNH